ncbi:MAG: hypothetical protein H3C54_10080 [Taibaiella sp.]|nr:hypothetical protein [Taibaiella sp.]
MKNNILLRIIFLVLLPGYFGCETNTCDKHTCGALIGNSTIAPRKNISGVAAFLRRDSVIRCHHKLIDLSVPGHNIAQQKNEWLNLRNKNDVKYVFVQVGLNDLHPPATFKSIAGSYQALIDTIRATAGSDIKIIAATMTPCKSFWLELYGPNKGMDCYVNWKKLNDAIMGRGGNPIMNVDYRIEDHTLLLRDTNDNLDVSYNSGDNIHENNEGRIIIANEYIKALKALNIR